MTEDANVALIDVRSEELREKDGVPDIRRAARFRYAGISPLEVDGSIRKLLKGGRDFDDSLIATIIRNLKTVKDSSKVIVLDADGTFSQRHCKILEEDWGQELHTWFKAASVLDETRSRIKELKPETALSILNEEAEAILESSSFLGNYWVMVQHLLQGCMLIRVGEHTAVNRCIWPQFGPSICGLLHMKTLKILNEDVEVVAFL